VYNGPVDEVFMTSGKPMIHHYQFDTPMKLVTVMEVCFNETISKVPITKHLSDAIPI
jgi:hypothetical protein